jgi:hypothetical protein
MDGFRCVPGVPEGWELVRIGSPVYGEWYIDNQGVIRRCEFDKLVSTNHVIVRKIEKPKRWRPFANAEEFKPHRDRWWRYKTENKATAHPPRAYSDSGWLTDTWGRLFEGIEFEDGTPYGAEVTDGE